MAINYNDSRFTELEKEEQTAKNQSNSTYDSLINESGKYYDNLINQSKDWADKQADIQNQQTEFTVQKIEQQKEQAAKDYTKEQKGAYQDYMKQSNAYGSNMQTAGQQGLGGSGWSETIQAGFYNTYQNRYAKARESYNEIVMNYNNNIKEAELQNSSALANIYANAQKEQLELALQSFTVIKDLKLEKQDKYLALDSEYNNRWRQVESQINTENALAEQIRQYNETLAEQKRQADMDQAYRNSQLALQKQQLAQEQAQWQAEYNLAKANQAEALVEQPKSNNDDSKKTYINTSKVNQGLKSTTVAPKTSSSSAKGTAKLVTPSGTKTGYTDGVKAYMNGSLYKKTGNTYGNANTKKLLNLGLIKKTTFNGKTYYYTT